MTRENATGPDDIIAAEIVGDPRVHTFDSIAIRERWVQDGIDHGQFRAEDVTTWEGPAGEDIEWER